MIPPAEVEISEDDFRRIAHKMFDVDDATLDRLYPMVCDLRDMARTVSEIIIKDNSTLSETATGD